MAGLLLTIHIIVSILLIVVILMQTSQRSGLGGLIGGSSDTLFGSSRATVLGKITTYLAITFMALTLILAMLSGRGKLRFGGPPVPKVGKPTYLDKSVTKEQEQYRREQQLKQQATQPPAGEVPESVEKEEKATQEPIPLPEEELAVPQLNLNTETE